MSRRPVCPPEVVEHLGMSGSQFRFRLERLRSLREQGEDAAKEALAGAMHDHRRSELELHRAVDSVARARAAQVDAGSGPTTAMELMSRQSYLERTERAQVARRQDLDHHEIELTARRHALTEAARERQALERLKERRRADHDREAARRESVDLDEMAITGFRRRPA
jgi:flagellar protein FliJ